MQSRQLSGHTGRQRPDDQPGNFTPAGDEPVEAGIATTRPERSDFSVPAYRFFGKIYKFVACLNTSFGMASLEIPGPLQENFSEGAPLSLRA